MLPLTLPCIWGYLPNFHPHTSSIAPAYFYVYLLVISQMYVYILDSHLKRYDNIQGSHLLTALI
jgi:hypothetical protein